MADFKKMIKLQSKRNAFWIMLTLVIFMMINAFFSSYQVKNFSNGIFDSISALEDIAAKSGKKIEKMEKPEKLTEDYILYGDKLKDYIVKRYNIKNNRDDDNVEDEDKFFAEDKDRDSYYSIEAEVNNYEYYREDLGGDKSKGFSLGFGTNALIIIFAFILSMFLTSMEHMTEYYDFTRMLPWSKSKDMGMRAGFGILIIAIHVLLFVLMNYFFIQNSNIADFVNLGNIFLLFLKELAFYLGLFLMFFSVGAMSGNILGHFGLTIISMGYLNLFAFIVSVLISLVKKGYSYDFYDKVFKFVGNQNQYVQTLLSPASHLDLSKESMLGFLTLGLLLFLISLSLFKKAKTERSGLMVLDKKIEFIAKTYAIFMLTSIAFDVMTGFLQNRTIIIDYIFYFLFLFASYKIFDSLFKIKLKL